MKNYFLKYIEKLKNNLFFQNVAIIASGSVIARIIGLFTAPIITRLYLPEDYGVLSVFTAFVGVAGTIATLRYEVTIPLPEKEKVANNLLWLSFLITLVLSAILATGTFLLGDWITIKFSITHVRAYLWIIPVSFLGAGIYQSLSFWATRHKYFKVITKTNITQSVASRAVKIGFGAIGIAPLGLLLGLVTTQFVGIGSILRKLFKDVPDFFKNFEWSEIKQAALRYKRFPIYQTWSQLLLGFGTHLPVMMIASIYGTKVVGLYGLAHGMVNMPMGLIGKAVSQVYYAEISKYGKENPEKIYKLTLSIMKKLFYAAIIPTIILIIGGPWLFSFVFGENWYDAGVFARILTFIILSRLTTSPIMHCFNVLEKQKAQLFLNVIRVLLVFLIFFLSKTLNLQAISTIWFYSISMSSYFLFMMILVLNMLKVKKQ